MAAPLAQRGSGSGSRSMRMVSGAEAIILPIAASHWCGSVRARAAGSSPGGLQPSRRAICRRL